VIDEYYTEELRADVGYSDEEDQSVDHLIDYKNALEDTVDHIEALLRSGQGISLKDWLVQTEASNNREPVY
jgi:hypothetical protein